MITHLDRLKTQHGTLRTHEQSYFLYYDIIATTHSKCDTTYILCNDSHNTCATMLENLEMIVMYVYMIRKTH